jgi:hypothetical protein
VETEIPKKIYDCQNIDMTIHWEALEEHFLMVPLVFRVLPSGHYRWSLWTLPVVPVLLK